MGLVLIIILAVAALAVVKVIPDSLLLSCTQKISEYSRKLFPPKPSPLPFVADDRPNLQSLHSRVSLRSTQADEDTTEEFVVEICGLIEAPEKGKKANIIISIIDITNGTNNPQRVHAEMEKWQLPGSQEFCYKSGLGKLPEKVTVLKDWTTVAKLRLDWLDFAHVGHRILQFECLVSAEDTGQRMASALCSFSFQNPASGYIDRPQNSQRTKTLAVALAFSTSASDDKLPDCEVDLIKKWARTNVDSPKQLAADERARKKLERALEQTAAFFRNGGKLNIFEICDELVQISSFAERYELLELCLLVVQAKGYVVTNEIKMLNTLAEELKVDHERFRSMKEKALPISMHKQQDTESVLGLTKDMNEDKARVHLNKEYLKWNARVTNSDPQVQSQADQMLKLIAEARNQYVKQN